jgi:hypothetical protein
VGSFFVSSPEEESPKDDQLRPRRIRRSTADRSTVSSGQHSFAGVGLSGASCTPMSKLLTGADDQETSISSIAGSTEKRAIRACKKLTGQGLLLHS